MTAGTECAIKITHWAVEACPEPIKKERLLKVILSESLDRPNGVLHSYCALTVSG